jgi:hypothetical protein
MTKCSDAVRWALAVALAAAWPATSWAAPPRHAQPAAGAPRAAEEEEEEPDDTLGRPRAAAPDDRVWHVLLAGRGGFTVPFGQLASTFPAGDVTSIGPAVGGSLGLGLGRHGVLEATFDYARLSGADRPASTGVPDDSEPCASVPSDARYVKEHRVVGKTCGGSTFAVGLGLVYHLSQGIAFDPWMSYGAGYRSLTVDAVLKNELPGSGDHAHLGGLEFARIGFGGDFFPIPSIGFGPYLELDLGTYVDRPAAPGPSVYAFFGLGARLIFDPVRIFRAPHTSVARAAGSAPATW